MSTNYEIVSLILFYQVANVRFNVAKTLTIVGPKLNSGVMQSQVKPCINKLNEDTDFDVRFFASEAAMGKFYLIRP
jgi:serine/threonine-protein phosphatase 2A regulatory subunit A